MKFFLVLLLFFCSVHADSFFPKSVSFVKNGKSYQLRMTGAVTRKKFFIKIYNVASYLDRRAEGDLLDEIMNDENAKQLTVKWTHDAPLGRVRQGYLASFRETLSEKEYVDLHNDINKYLAFFPKDIKKGDEHILRWSPGGHIESSINGRVSGTITNLPFAKALWNIWFSGGAGDGGSLLTLGNIEE